MYNISSGLQGVVIVNIFVVFASYKLWSVKMRNMRSYTQYRGISVFAHSPLKPRLRFAVLFHIKSAGNILAREMVWFPSEILWGKKRKKKLLLHTLCQILRDTEESTEGNPHCAGEYRCYSTGRNDLSSCRRVWLTQTLWILTTISTVHYSLACIALAHL